MPRKAKIFDENYASYLNQVASLNLLSNKFRKLGLLYNGGDISVPFINNTYRIKKDIIIDDRNGKKASYFKCVIFCKYILLCPENEPDDNNEWITYKNFKDAAPLLNYFNKNVEGPLSDIFSNKIEMLETACDKLKGTKPDIAFPYDFSREFLILPKLPVLLLFNDKDEDFPAQCKVLFRENAVQYLDPECLAMAAVEFVHLLQESAK